MLQNSNSIATKNDNFLRIHGSCVVNNNLWFTLAHYNGLCKMSLDSSDVNYMSYISGEKYRADYLYGDIKRYRNKLVLVPMYASELAIYDMNTGSVDKVPILRSFTKNKIRFEGGPAFYTGIILRDNIYLIPHHFPAIVSVNLLTNKVQYYDDYMEEIVPDYEEDKVIFREDVVTNHAGDTIYLTSIHYGALLTFNVKEGKAKYIIKHPKLGDGFSCVCKTDNGFVVTQTLRKRMILLDDNFVEVFNEQYEVTTDDDNKLDFIGSIKIGSTIFFIPYGSYEMMSLNIDTHAINYPMRWNLTGGPKFTRFWEYGGKLFCYRDGVVDTFDSEGNFDREYSLCVDCVFWGEALSKMSMCTDIIEETNELTFNSFLYSLSLNGKNR